jgi:serine protease AprX
MKITRKIIQISLIALLLGLYIGPTQVTAQYPKAQTELTALAFEDPEQVVSVIVQKANQGSGVEMAATRLGGNITRRFGIIQAFAVEMTSGAALELAKAPGVRWVSLDAAVNSTACAKCVDTTKLVNAYIGAIRANQVWNSSAYIQGKGIGIAVVDSGVNPNGDLYTQMGVNRQIADVTFNSDFNQSANDGYGHGTHVASIAGGDGSESGGQYIGVAPMANIINVKVSNDDGSSKMTDVVEGLQWVLENKNTYNIRVVNLSINSSVAESYKTNPLDAAVEILWFNGIVVVVSAGNAGSGAIYPPANDPFVITVGATDDKGTSAITDDTMATFSAFGKAENGAVKPDLVAPGKNITARIVNLNMGIAGAHPANVVGNQYFRMSGTSMAAPMVSGAVALLLQDEPTLTPDQVKYRLLTTANKTWAGYTAAKAGAGYLDIYAAVNGTSTNSANTGIKASSLLTTGTAPVSSSVAWNSVAWNSVAWNSVAWNSVAWNSVAWNSDYWGN